MNGLPHPVGVIGRVGTLAIALGDLGAKNRTLTHWKDKVVHFHLIHDIIFSC